jgi:hypothetical protein
MHGTGCLAFRCRGEPAKCALHAEGIVAQILRPCLTEIHAKRAAALTRATAALLRGGITSLSAIALHLGRGIALKHRLKSVDRLLGNCALHRERFDVYRRLARQWLQGVDQWLIVIDWSDVTPDQRWQLLRAGVVVEGRSITLYEEVHPQRKLGNPTVHRAFVQRLKNIVPAGCRVIVMTDAGFHAPWFKLIGEQGWQFIGRIRGKNQLQLGENEPWMAARDLYRRAGTQACDLGVGLYVRSNPVTVRAVLAKRPLPRTPSPQPLRQEAHGACERQMRARGARTLAAGIEPRVAPLERRDPHRPLRATHAHRAIVSRYQERANGARLGSRALSQRTAF